MSLLQKTNADRIFDVVIIIILGLFCLSILLPFFNLVSVSLSSDYYVQAGKVTFWPRDLSLFAYERVLETQAISRAYANTIYVAIIGCVLGLIFTSIATYPIVFGEFYGKKFYNVMIMFTMWFSGGMIPSFMVINKLGLVDSLWSLILFSLIGTYNVIIMRSFFEGIPKSLVESAVIDGANDFVVLFRIVIPLSKAVLATIALWIIVGHWNDFMHPLIYLKNFKNFTLQVVLRDIVLTANASYYDVTVGDKYNQEHNVIPEQISNAVIVVSMIPVLIIYPFLQKYFVQGITLGAVKG